MQQRVDWARETVNEESMHYEKLGRQCFTGSCAETMNLSDVPRGRASHRPSPRCLAEARPSLYQPSGCARGGRRGCGAGPTRGFSGPGHTPRVGGAAGWGRPFFGAWPLSLEKNLAFYPREADMNLSHKLRWYAVLAKDLLLKPTYRPREFWERRHAGAQLLDGRPALLR